MASKTQPVTSSILLVLMLAAICSAACTDKQAPLDIQTIGRYSTGVFDAGAAEISAHDAATQRLFVVNSADKTVDVVDISNPAAPSKVGSLDLALVDPEANAANSVASHAGMIAVAVENKNKQANGWVAVYSAADLSLLASFEAGALPDMVTFSPNGLWLLAANEGEPSDDYSNDPEGSVSIVDLRTGIASATVAHANFRAFNDNIDPEVRVFGPSATVAQDLEPEYIAVNANSTKAYVGLQENNAVAVVDIASATVTAVKSLGFKDHSIAGHGFDASDKDDAINIQPWPVMGMFQPDSLAWFEHNGQGYLITANEGDSRDYDGFSEETRVKDLALDPEAFANAAALQSDEQLGRLKVTTTLGDIDGDGDYDQLFSYGTRSFAIFNADTLELVWDSADDFEQIIAGRSDIVFNANNDDNAADKRSDDKGPEPEAVTVAQLGDKRYAFIGLERVGGIMVYDISNPNGPAFVRYDSTRNYQSHDLATDLATAGDLAPEGLLVIPAANSPTGKPLLVSSNEVSGTVALQEIRNTAL